MSMLPLGLPWEPDKGPLTASALNVVLNAQPLPEGWGPLPSLTLFSQPLPSECKGAWWFRSDDGVFNTVVATQHRLYKMSGATVNWIDISQVTSDTASNGAFTTDTAWTKGAGITISGGNAVFTAVGDSVNIRQAQTLTAGDTYRIAFTVTEYTSGGVRPTLIGGTAVDGTTVNAVGTYSQDIIAGTGNTDFGFEAVGTSTLKIDNVSIRGVTDYVGPDEGELWTATVFGSNFYVTNVNDPVQYTGTGAVGNFEDAPGNPPQAKYIATIGDFIFLAHLREGATVKPRKWQHSKINDPGDWLVDGSPGASDDQEIPDGDDIVGIIPMAGASARIIQKRARKALIFTPGSSVSFQQVDIDATRGAAAPHAIVSLGSNDYFFLNENGFFMNDEYRPIGAERVDRTFLADCDPARLRAVKASADVARKIVWVSYQDATNVRKTWGYSWQLDRWFPTDYPTVLCVSTASPGYVLDDLTGTLDDYPDIPVDSPYWQGGQISFGAFKDDFRMHLFAGEKAAATIETNTTQLAEGLGAFVTGAAVVGNITDYTVQHGVSFLPGNTVNWSGPQLPSQYTGICPFSQDGKYHRFRLNINAGGEGTHVYGIRPQFKVSTRA